MKAHYKFWPLFDTNDEKPLFELLHVIRLLGKNEFLEKSKKSAPKGKNSALLFTRFYQFYLIKI